MDQFGPWFSYNETARAQVRALFGNPPLSPIKPHPPVVFPQIFRRDAPKVTDEAAFRKLVRYNDFQHDPISRQVCHVNA